MSKKGIDTCKFPPFVYGLQGIMDLFGVSKSTAYKYKNGLLKDAITQNGDIILVDTVKALTLFGVKDAASFITAPELTSSEIK